MNAERLYDGYTIIIPTLNEAENIGRMVPYLSQLYPGVSIIISDDGSKDGMVEKVKDLQKTNPLLTIIQRNPHDKGLTASVMDGILNTKTAYFVVMDADFQHPPETAGEIMTRLGAGKEMVVGVRNSIYNMPFSRKLASWGAHNLALLYLRLVMRPKTRDIMSGFFGMKTEVAQKIIGENQERFERRGFKVLFDILKFAPRKIKVDEVRFDFGIRTAGQSKLSTNVILSLLRQCGILGRGAASMGDFLVYNRIGRLVAPVAIVLFSVMIMLLSRK